MPTNLQKDQQALALLEQLEQTISLVEHYVDCPATALAWEIDRCILSLAPDAGAGHPGINRAVQRLVRIWVRLQRARLMSDWLPADQPVAAGAQALYRC